MTPRPVRQHRPEPIPRPDSKFDRTCVVCGAGWAALIVQEPRQRGRWVEDWKWCCSQECADAWLADR